MKKKEIAKEFTRQMLDPNQPSVNFGQVTNMLKEVEQVHAKVRSEMEKYLTKIECLAMRFPTVIQLESLEQQL